MNPEEFAIRLFRSNLSRPPLVPVHVLPTNNKRFPFPPTTNRSSSGTQGWPFVRPDISTILVRDRQSCDSCAPPAFFPPLCPPRARILPLTPRTFGSLAKPRFSKILSLPNPNALVASLQCNIFFKTSRSCKQNCLGAEPRRD